jgi:xanthine dehydrogenase accessory factor
VRDLLDELDTWRAAGHRAAIARVVDVDGSGPRDPGAAMAVRDDGLVIGSVSGGCVEGAAVEAAMATLETDAREVHTFGYSDSDAFAVGLTCGGTIHLFIEPLDDRSMYDELAANVRASRPVALATAIRGPIAGAKLLVSAETPAVGTLGDPDLDRVVIRDAQGELAAGVTRIRHYGHRGEARQEEVSVFIESFVPPPQMVIFGAVDFTAALVRVAKVLGYRVTVCDARPVFTTRDRFPEADDVVVDWPDRFLDKVGPGLTTRDAICVLTHDAKFDIPAIVAGLATDVGYVGAMGSRRTHRARVEHLKNAGVDDAALARLRAPIGLDLGSRTPEETAVAICAEIIAARYGRTDGRPLSTTEGPIHGQVTG